MFPEDLSTFTVAGITELRNAAAAQLATLRAAIESPEAATDEQVAEMEGLFNYVTKADAEIAARNERASKIASFTVTETAVSAEVTPTETVETEVKDVVESVQASTNAVTEVVSAQVAPGGEGIRRSVQLSDVAGNSTVEATEFREEAAYTIRAAADVPNFVTGQELDWSELGKAFEARARGYGNARSTNGKGSRAQHGFALIERQFPEAQQLLDNDGDMGLYNKLTEVQKNAGRVAADTNALVAAAGWCAPSETIYSTVNPVTADGLLDLPEVVARRGGIRHNQGINWATFFGGTYPALDANVPGMTLLTEAQVIADTAKTCLEIDCPSFIDERLNVAALCLTGSLLQNRGYPEYVAEFTRGAMASFQHLVNREIIDILEDGSTGVVLSAVDPWQVEGTVVTSIMAAVEMAVVDMRYRLRLSLTAPIDFVFPEWVRAQMRADWSRRNAAQPVDLVDAEIAAMFARRGARVQYVYDWQDAFSGVTTGPGALTAPVQLPNSVKFLAFPPGTWILARQDVIRLDTVYDSVNLQLNQVTQLFMEDGYLPMRMGPLSRVYTLPIAPSGITGAQRAAGTGLAGGAAMAYTDVTP
jgi:hypothetical protein